MTANPVSQVHCVRARAWWKLKGFPAVSATGYTHTSTGDCACVRESQCVESKRIYFKKREFQDLSTALKKKSQADFPAYLAFARLCPAVMGYFGPASLVI